jgi:serine/threonine protein kinase
MPLAVKVVKLVSASQAEVEKEIGMLQGLSHPHIVRCFGAEVQEGKAVIAMEFCAGGSLLQNVQSQGRLKQITIASVFRQVAEGLLFLHQNRVMHRDLKPHNILLTECGVAKLADFGCSSLMEVDKTSTKTVAGTVVYMAPECLVGRSSFPSDMWSLGMTVLHCVTGVRPWSHVKTPQGHAPLEPQLIWHICQPENEHLLPADLEPWLSGLIRGCLIRDPTQRLTCDKFIGNLPHLDARGDVQNVW